jgi:hypothetical protein
LLTPLMIDFSRWLGEDPEMLPLAIGGRRCGRRLDEVLNGRPASPGSAVVRRLPIRQLRTISAEHMALSSVATSRLAFNHALDAGLLDEIWVDLVPVLLGKGERFFDQLKEVPVELEGTDVDVQGVASPTCVTGSTTRECGCGSLAAAPCRGEGIAARRRCRHRIGRNHRRQGPIRGCRATSSGARGAQ